MGIRYLNRYLREKCSEEIKQIHLSKLEGKIIVIDTSIYMYRFEGDGGLIDGIYQLIILLRHYNIIPIFIFDGVAPPEKHDLLKKRKKIKDIAESRYNEIKYKLINANRDETNDLQAELNILRKQFIRLKNDDIENVKQLMSICGVSYYVADGEADQLCAKLVLENKAYACLSEDTDMFVYGCPRVLRYLSLLNSTVVIYDFNSILNKLEMTNREFKEVCILSGSDYNSNITEDMTLFKTMKWFNKYKIYYNNLLINNSIYKKQGFYEWLKNNTNYIKKNLNLIYLLKMFDLSDVNVKEFDKYNVVNMPINNNELKKFLYNYDFIFA